MKVKTCTEDSGCLCDQCYDKNIGRLEELEKKVNKLAPKWMNFPRSDTE